MTGAVHSSIPSGLPPTPCSNKMALIIGNSSYPQPSQLSNCVNDATDVASCLQCLGFQTTLRTDLTRTAFKEAIARFVSEFSPNTTGVLYFSGHGKELCGENFLFPVDTFNRGIKLNKVLRMVNKQSQTQAPSSVFCCLLDCCRENLTDHTFKSPGPVPCHGGMGFPSLQGASMAIGFATNPGDVAKSCPTSRNSFYTAALLDHLPKWMDLCLMHRQVAADVMAATQNQQRPWLNSTLPPGLLVL